MKKEHGLVEIKLLTELNTEELSKVFEKNALLRAEVAKDMIKNGSAASTLSTPSYFLKTYVHKMDKWKCYVDSEWNLYEEITYIKTYSAK